MDHRVFISYAADKGDSTGSKERQAADMICSALESEGIRCWIAPRDILPGDDWLDAIIDAVEKSEVVVLVFSANANLSQWVKDEIKLALDKNIKIIPFRIDDVSPQGGLRILKVRHQWLDAYTPPLEKHIERLVKIVSEHLGIVPAIPIKKEKLTEQPETDRVKSVIEDVKAVKEKTFPPKDEEKQPEVVKEVIRKEEKKPGKPLLQKRILIAVSIIILLTAAVFLISQLVKKEETTTRDTPTEIVKPADTADDTSQKQKSAGKIQKKTEEKAPGTKIDGTPPKKASTDETKKIPQEEYIVKSLPGGDQVSEPKKIIKKLKEEPAFIKEVKSKGAQVKQIGKDLWEAYYEKYDITMVYIGAGEFTMGSNDHNDERPPHTVYLDGYWMGKYEVTFDQYDKYCKETDKKEPDDEGWGRGKRPVINVSWHDAAAYCNWLSKKIGLTFKLPTEAQWEKAARGTDGRTYPWGNIPPTGDIVNFADKQAWLKKKFDWADKTIDDGYAYTAPVGSFPKGVSPYGLLDMAGNVWEWCNDWYAEDYYKNSPRKNPQGPESGPDRVLRGGSWFDVAAGFRCAFRYGSVPSLRYFFLGVRLSQDNR